jgi:replicative DNA helicase
MKLEENYGGEFGLKFQEHILAIIARVPAFALRYRQVLRPEFFESKDHRAIAKTLLTYTDEYSDLPTEATLIEKARLMVSDDERDVIEKRVIGLYSQSIADSQSVMDMVIEFGRNQAMVNAVLQAGDKLSKGDRDIRSYIDEAMLVGQDLLDLGHNYKKDAATRLHWYLHPEEQLLNLVPTGITHVDIALNGGLARGEMGVILAPPKRGKSTILINIGYGALVSPLGLNVVHFTLEMGREKVARRYDDRLMGGKVRSRAIDPQAYVAELADRVERDIHGQLFVKEYPTRSATVADMRSFLSIVTAQGFPPDVVIVDYADIVKASRRMGEMRHEQAGIYEDLRALAGEFNVALWTGSQAGRAALDKEVITINDFAESFEKAAIVDAVWAFCQTLDEKIDNECRLFGAALRGVEDGVTAVCAIDRDACLVESIELRNAAYATVDNDPSRQSSREEVAPVVEEGGTRKAELLPRKKVRKKVRRIGETPTKRHRVKRPSKRLD